MNINDKILPNKSVLSILKDLSERVKMRRLEKNWTQEEIAKRSGMSLASYRRFERTGEIAFTSLVKIAFVLDEVDQINKLFTHKHYSDIEDVLNTGKVKTRKRAGRK